MKFNVIICEDVKNTINRISSVVKDKYSDYELQMLTAFLVYSKEMNDLQTNNIIESDM